ncbi:uncharacterized protein LOC117220075 isoform X3 [Megalopta genalis]|uniref:uncharacterized protein LOC117220075 isoform X3 n=1 Tax=Megalopta genalis TaxID=115081 RepID=UPI003FD6028D
MANRKFCVRKDELRDDEEWLAFSLEIFSRAFHLLKNFTEFLKSRMGNCCGIDHDRMHLFGALSVVAGTMKYKRPDLFRDICGCIRQDEQKVIPDYIIQNINKVLTNLQKCCVIENIVCDVKDMLEVLEEILICSTSVELGILSYLLHEIMKKLISCRETSPDQLTHADVNRVLRLVNNFIRDWSMRNSLCRFCGRAASKVAQQWGTYCCRSHELYYDVCEEWWQQQTISNDWKTDRSDNRMKQSKSDDDYTGFFSGGPGDRRVAGDESNVEDTRWWTACVPRKPGVIDRAIKRWDNDGPIAAFRRVAGSSSRKTEAGDCGAAGRGPDKFEEIEDGDLRTASCRTIEGGRAPARCRRREKRDGALCEERAGLRGALDADLEGTAVGKMSEIKSDKISARDRRRGRLFKRDGEVNGTDQSPGKKAGDPSRLGHERGYPKADSPKDIRSGTMKPKAGDYEDGQSDRDRKTPIGKKSKAKKLGLGDDEEYEEPPRSKKKSKRAQSLEPIDEEYGKRAGSRKRLSGRTRGKEDTDDEERTDRRGTNKVGIKKNHEFEGRLGVGEDISAREQTKKKKGALDSTEGEESVRKRDGKRRGRSSDDEADSDVMKRGKAGKIRGARTGDKSTAESEGKSKKETREAGTEGRTKGGPSKADGDYSKINGSRYYRDTTKAPDLYRTEGSRLIEYQLSNQSFVKRGWTTMPIPKTMRKVSYYQAKSAKPHMNWFERHKHQGKIYYNDGVSIFVNFHPDGTVDVFYPNGKLAIAFRKSSNRKYGMYTVFTPGGKDCVGVERKSQIVGVFDTVGNGAVFDEDGATRYVTEKNFTGIFNYCRPETPPVQVSNYFCRLSYNQIGGIWGDNPAGPPLVWKWDADEKNLLVETVYLEKPVNRIERFLHRSTRSLKSSGSGKAASSPASSRNKEKKVVEQKPVVAVHDTEEEVTSGTFSVQDDYTKDNPLLKMICLKLTRNISLRLSNRRDICLQFFAAGKNIRIEIGTVLNFEKKVASHFVDTSLRDGILKCP